MNQCCRSHGTTAAEEFAILGKNLRAIGVLSLVP